MVRPSCTVPAVVLAALKKKRMYKQQLEQVENSLLCLSEQLVGLEGVRATAETVAAMQAGSEAGQAVAAELNVQRVDTLLDDVADQAEAMRQVAHALGQPLGAALDVDEDELAAELEVSLMNKRFQPWALASGMQLPLDHDPAALQELEAAQLGGARMQAPAHAITAADQGAASAPPNRQAPAAPRALSVEEEELEAMQADMAM